MSNHKPLLFFEDTNGELCFLFGQQMEVMTCQNKIMLPPTRKKVALLFENL